MILRWTRGHDSGWGRGKGLLVSWKVSPVEERRSQCCHRGSVGTGVTQRGWERERPGGQAGEQVPGGVVRGEDTCRLSRLRVRGWAATAPCLQGQPFLYSGRGVAGCQEESQGLPSPGFVGEDAEHGD